MDSLGFKHCWFIAYDLFMALYASELLPKSPILQNVLITP